MITSAFATDTAQPPAIDSVQLTADGAPRFRVPVRPDDPRWLHAARCEQAGGVAAEGRVFLDEQLGTGDLVLDLDPGFGFLALSAATSPGGVPTVLIAESDNDHVAALQDAAADAGAWLESLEDISVEGLSGVIEARLERDAGLFVHLSDSQLADLKEALRAPAADGKLLAVLLSTIGPDRWADVSEQLAGLGMRACALAATDEGTVLLPTDTIPEGTLIAVPAALFAESALHDALAEPAPATQKHSSSAHGDAGTLRSDSLHEGFSFIAPHARTGYGVAGANLLMALQRRSVPVAFFPLGAVDTTLTNNPGLSQALSAQASFPDRAPSVRMSQAFDLAMHSGRGARVGFPIFESEIFSARELHHLQAQDALLVCTSWARDVVRANGLADVPVHIVPLGADPAVFHPDVTAVRRGSETVFLHFGKLEARKGQLELLRAFEAAFAPSDPVRLVLACHNPFLSASAFDTLLMPFRRSPMARRITLQTTELPTANDVAALMATADCGVFPARAEGWNLELVEMLAMAKPVIATAATAHTAYLTTDNARLIALGNPEPATAGNLMGNWGSWGTAQHEQLVTELRAVHRQRMSGTLVPNAAGLVTARTLTWDASAQAMLAALETLT